MRRKPEISDYEPVTRSRGSGASEAAGDDWNFRSETSSSDDSISGQVERISAHVRRPPSGRKRKEYEPFQARILKRGHAVSFVFLFLFTAVVYFRPYELFPALADLTSLAKWLAIITLVVFLPSQLVVEGNITTRGREVNLVLLLTLATFISVPLAISPTEAWDHFSEYMKVVVMFVVMVNVVRSEKRLRLMLLLALVASMVMSIAALSDYRAGRLLVGGERIKGVIGGLFDNPNDLALHLVTMVPIAVGLALSSRLPKRIIYGVCSILMLSAVIVTFSRGGFLGLAAAIMVLAWKLGRKNRALVITVLLAGIIAFFTIAPAEYGGRLATIWGGDATGSATARQQLFWRSARVALRYPLFGVGIGNFHFRSLREQVSHNAYTQVASEVGLAALVCYVLFMVFPLKKLRQIEREAADEKSRRRFYYLSIGLQASLVAYMVSSFFASVAFLWYVYYLVGYSVCVVRIYEAVAIQPSAASQEASTTSDWKAGDLDKAQAL